jgi:hypothetical protein
LPRGSLTPKIAGEALEVLLDEGRIAQASEPVVDPEVAADDARNVAKANLLPRFGRDTPLYSIERDEVVVRRNGRQFLEVREERRDRFTTDDIDAYRRELLASDLSPRTAQKVLALLHGVFKLAKRRKLIIRIRPRTPSASRSRTRACSTSSSRSSSRRSTARSSAARTGVRNASDDEIDRQSQPERELYGAFLSTAFYAGSRLGEVPDRDGVL